MLRIRISSLKPGVLLAKDIFSYDGKLLLPKETVLTQEHLNVFLRRNIEEVFLLETGGNKMSDEEFQDAYKDSLNVTKSFILEAKLGKPLDKEEILGTVEMLVEQVFDQNDLFRQMRMMKEKDEYLFTHSVNVSLLCILIGRWLELEESEVRKLGVAGLVHDIGKIHIPDAVLNKVDKLTDDEFQQIKKHPLIGYNMIKEYDWVDIGISTAVLMHHERSDGSGYPLGKMGTAIHPYASIVAVADVYDALTSQRSYHHKISPYSAAEVLWQQSFGKLDPRIAKVFYDKITNFYIGNEVILSNHEQGMVVFVDPSQPTRPMVKVGDKFINLAQDRSLTILEVID
ncbi:MAG: HD-GYP domain-containing protein [Bacillota bacterium]|nr:HD-GYP domain-containing protein [Bacillota bacterium]